MYEKVLLLQKMLTDVATNGNSYDEAIYTNIRKELMESVSLKQYVPGFVKSCRTQGALWSYFKSVSPHWQPRREHIEAGFVQLLDYLENKGSSPISLLITEALSTFGTEGIEHAWAKALDRRTSDPEGAITAARTMLETVCKQILDKSGVAYKDTDDLPKLYHETALQLNLAPSLHTEEVFKTILGNCQSVINNIASIRNKIGDAHGKGGKPIKPHPRHAALAVNLSGTMATFLVETYLAKEN